MRWRVRRRRVRRTTTEADMAAAKTRCRIVDFSEEKMVGVRGFEPPTPASRTQCSTRLSHTPTVGAGLAASPRSEDAAYSHAFETPQASISPFFARTENSPERGCCIPNRFGLSDRLRRTERSGNAGPAGEWCNGNTTVFGTVILGSSPSSPAIRRPSGPCDRTASNLWHY